MSENAIAVNHKRNYIKAKYKKIIKISVKK